jgi:hypothetical protein
VRAHAGQPRMTAIPKSLAAATRLLERYADLDARLALVEEDRTAAIAAANQRADVAATPMIKERDSIAPRSRAGGLVQRR